MFTLFWLEDIPVFSIQGWPTRYKKKIFTKTVLLHSCASINAAKLGNHDYSVTALVWYLRAAGWLCESPALRLFSSAAQTLWFARADSRSLNCI